MLLPLSTRVTPVGRLPFSEMAAAGKPVVVTVKLPALPTMKVVLEPEVMAEASSTVSVNDWLAAFPTPLVALKLMA